MIDSGAGLGARGGERPEAQEIFQQLRYATQAVEIDALPRPHGSARAREPVSQCRGAQVLRVQHLHEPQGLQALGTDELLAPRLHPGNDQSGFAEREDLAHRVVAAHSHDVIRVARSEEHTSELQSLAYLVCRLLLEKKKKEHSTMINTM